MNSPNALSPTGRLIRNTGRWFTVIGVVFVVLGILAIIEPAVAGLTVTILVGWMFVFGGVAHAFGAFGGGGAGRIVWNVIVAAIYILGGIYLLAHPLLGLGTLTLFLAAILLSAAVVEIISSVAHRGEGAGWRIANGLVTLLLGGLIWIHWPSSSIWAIGTLVGVNLIATGFSRLMLGSAARRLAA